MNAYLSREEREQYIRLTCLRVVIDNAIETYSGLKNIDKPFISDLKHARTRLDKALNIRLEALDPEANENLYKAASKLKLMFLATPEAKKAHEEMLVLKSTLPMSREDFEDWYSFVIENSCKTCTREDYAECPARRVLTKYDVFPADPAAQGKCQYSYVGTEMAERPEIETDGEYVPVFKYNYAVAQNLSLETKINEQYLPEIKELRQRLAELEAAGSDEAAQPSCLLPVTLGLASGIKIDLDLPEHMAKCLLNEMQRFDRKSRGLCACHVDDELITVDMEEVVVMKLPGMTGETWSRQAPQGARPAFDDSGERERYRVECKCGTEYFCGMNIGRDRARCRECKSMVFADRQADPVIDPMDGTQATLLTNRYWVGKEIPRESAAQPNVQGSRDKYRDPCDPFKRSNG